MKKKILFAINTLGGAGAENALIELLNRLSPEEYDCALYVLTGQGEMVHKLPPYVRLLNAGFSDESVLSAEGRRMLRKTVIKAALTRGTIFRRFPDLCANFLRMLSKGKVLPDKLLWRVLSDGGQRFSERYDLAVAYLEGGSAYYVADHVNASKRAAFVHIDYGRAGYTRRLDKDCYLKYDRIFAVSDEVKEHFLAAYPECGARTDVFHNLLDMGRITERAKEPGGFSDLFSGTRILTVGRLTTQKAYDIALDALKLLKDDGYAVRWYVLGEGDQRPLLEKKRKQLGLTDDFVLVGAVDNPFPWYAQTDIYVHATRFEGKSIAIQEAQILGCAIVASDCSGNREQITDGVDGRLCALSAGAIRDAVAALIEKPQLRQRYGQAAQEKISGQKEDLEKLLALLPDD